MTPRVVVYTKPGCHLCEVAEETIAQVCSGLNVEWKAIDISADKTLLESYAEQIPVTFVDGRQHDYWRVDPDRLRTALT